MPPPPRRRRKPRAKCFVLLPVLGALTLYAYVVLKHFRPTTEQQHTVEEWVDDDPKTHFFREEALLHQPTPAPSYSTKTDDAIRSLYRGPRGCWRTQERAPARASTSSLRL